jgi:hypothetical protein
MRIQAQVLTTQSKEKNNFLEPDQDQDQDPSSWYPDSKIFMGFLPTRSMLVLRLFLILKRTGFELKLALCHPSLLLGILTFLWVFFPSSFIHASFSDGGR